MKVYDPLYGSFILPSFASELFLTPAVRRLSSVRLLNYGAPSLATLGEMRRYSHTMGVVRLALENSLLNLSEVEMKTVIAAVILHDVGTPPFGHLFEYRLKEWFDWSHESILGDLLRNEHVSEGSAHAFSQGGFNQLDKIIKRHNIDRDLLLDIVGKRSYLSSYVFGSLDFDNMDNVARMNWGLGNRVEVDKILSLARAVNVSPLGDLLLAEKDIDLVAYWAKLRKDAYDVLVFDEYTVSGQAVITKALDLAFANGEIVLDDWDSKDEQLTDTLSVGKSTKDIIGRDIFGGLPPMILFLRDLALTPDEIAQLDQPLAGLIELFLEEAHGLKRTYGYVFRDRGTFSKRLEFKDPDTGNAWALGERSQSTILYGFSKADRPMKLTPAEVGGQFESWVKRRAAVANTRA
jgi:HD superfamily phosphohydrolase